MLVYTLHRKKVVSDKERNTQHIKSLCVLFRMYHIKRGKLERLRVSVCVPHSRINPLQAV